MYPHKQITAICVPYVKRYAPAILQIDSRTVCTSDSWVRFGSRPSPHGILPGAWNSQLPAKIKITPTSSYTVNCKPNLLYYALRYFFILFSNTMNFLRKKNPSIPVSLKKILIQTNMNRSLGCVTCIWIPSWWD